MADIIWKLQGPSSGGLREVDLAQPGYKKWSLWWIEANEDGLVKSKALTFTASKPSSTLSFWHRLN